METRNVFLYWVGHEYKLISILRKLIYIHSKRGKGYNVILITANNLHEYVKNIPECFNKLYPAHQADFIRASVICEYGGIWLDSDTLVLDNLDSLFDILERKDGFFITESTDKNRLCIGVFGSKPQTPAIKYWKTRILDILNEKGNNISWNEIAIDILQPKYTNDKSIFANYEIFYGIENMYPVNWDVCVDEYILKPYDNYKTIVRDYQPLLILVNTVYRCIENNTEERILNAKMPLNYFIRKSFENGLK